MVTSFVLDSKHLIFIGVLRRRLYAMKGTIKDLKKGKLSRQQLRHCEQRLALCSGRLPSEFVRQPRPLEDLDYWKATELRSFLLYSGLAVLKGVLNDDAYTHFVYLSVGIRLLSLKDEEKRNESLAYARELLNAFVKNSKLYYGSAFVVYNVHSLTHITDDVEKFNSPLQEISAFKFENRLQGVKRTIRGRRFVLEQVYRRNEEQLRVEQKKKHQSTKVTATVKDSCFLTETKVVFVTKVAASSVKCRCYRKVDLDNHFHEPLSSMRIGIYYVPSRARSSRQEIPRERLLAKCVCLPYKDGHVVLPLVDHD